MPHELQQIPAGRERDLLELLCLTGLRIGEACRLTSGVLTGSAEKFDGACDDSWTTSVRWFVVTKSKTPAGTLRRVPIVAALSRTISRLAVDRRADQSIVPWVQAAANHQCKAILRETLGPAAEDIDLHSCRRGFSDACQKSGVPEDVAAAIVGHRHKSITYGLYARGPSDDMLIEAALKVAEFYRL
jgi:integrase